MGIVQNSYASSSDNSFAASDATDWGISDFPAVVLTTYVDQEWVLYFAPISYVDQDYRYFLQGIVGQDYTLLEGLQGAIVAQVWGLNLGATYNQLYGDSNDPTAILMQLYRDAGQVEKILNQWYRGAIQPLSFVDQEWRINGDALNYIAQVYGISSAELLVMLQSLYDLKDLNHVDAVLRQLYLLQDDTITVNADSFSIVLNDTLTLDSESISIEGSVSDYKLTCDLLLTKEHFYACSELDKLTININSEQFIFYIYELKRNIPKRGEIKYYCRAYSKAFMLDAPYSSTLTQEFTPAMASSIVTSLAATQGISVEWNVVDWYISANKLYAEDAPPIDIIREIKDVVGAILQSSPDGTLRVEYKYKQALSDVDFSPEVYLRADANFFNISESSLKKQGYNRYMVSDQLASSESITIEELEDGQTPTTRYLAGYVVPWSGEQAVLTTSSTDVSSIEYDSIVEEDVTEEVEFVNGTSSTSKPMYALIDVTWNDAVLGTITFGEDGNLSASIVDGPTEGCSLASVTYTTKYYRWRVTSSNFDEEVQFLLSIGE